MKLSRLASVRDATTPVINTLPTVNISRKRRVRVAMGLDLFRGYFI
jgi:hypothetical protein